MANVQAYSALLDCYNRGRSPPDDMRGLCGRDSKVEHDVVLENEAPLILAERQHSERTLVAEPVRNFKRACSKHRGSSLVNPLAAKRSGNLIFFGGEVQRPRGLDRHHIHAQRLCNGYRPGKHTAVAAGGDDEGCPTVRLFVFVWQQLKFCERRNGFVKRWKCSSFPLNLSLTSRIPVTTMVTKYGSRRQHGRHL
jgi:hypothetical protein